MTDTAQPVLMGAEDRAHRLHALVWVITHLDLDGVFDAGGDRGVNARGNLLRIARDESEALLDVIGFGPEGVSQ